ncbi:MAG: magnesium transporter [Tenericutes bacterium]|nr:magnesium transporter [Mycoplasmatota bacterium]
MYERIYNLIEQKDIVNLKLELLKLNEADIAEILDEINDNEKRIRIFRLLPKTIAADVFADLDLDNQQNIITSLSMKEAGTILDNLFADDAVDLIEEMPANIVTKLLKNTTKETRADINFLLKYPINSAGSIMNTAYIDLKENITVNQAIEKIRKEKEDTETLNICFVLDKERKLKGAIFLKDLLFNKPETLIKDIMETKVLYVNTYDDQEEVANSFSKYDVNTMPVVDSENRMVGIITIDDIVDIMEQEATEDIEKMAAISPTDKPYMKTSVFETWKKRIPWLLLLMISATFTGKIIQTYEEALASYVILTSFIPMFMDTGGNAGGQASVTIIRGISLKEIEFKDILKIMWKEFRVAILTGITLAAANFIKLLVIDKVNMSIASVVCLTLIVTIIFAKIVGCTLPLLAKKVGFDPAVMASPFITTIVDALSLITYFQIATILLGL